MPARHRPALRPKIAPLVRSHTRESSAVLVTRWKLGRTRGATRAAGEVASGVEARISGRSARWHASGRSQLAYGPSPASGTINIAELFARYPTLALPVRALNNSTNDPDERNDDCVIGDPSASR
jgi:hypothetical protein